MGEDKGSLIQQKAKSVCRGKGKTKDLLSASHQQGMSRYFLGSRVSVHLMVALEDKCHNNECPPSLRFSLWADTLCCGISLWSLWVSCPLYVSSQDLAPPAFWWGGNVGETALMLWKHSSVSKTLVCYQYLSRYQCMAQRYEGCCGEN